MRRTLETIFRHPLQILVLLVLPIAVSVAIAVLQPRSYRDTASLWAMRRYSVVGAADNSTDITVPPAQTQATALTELLQTRAFALDVANQTSLASQLSASTRADPELRADALVTEVGRVQVAPVSYNLFTISYQNKDPLVAEQVVKGVISEYGVQSTTFSVAEANRLIAIYQNELQAAQKDVDTRVAAAVQYLHQNPGVDPRTDPQYLQLQAQANQAQNRANDIQGQMATLNQEISAQGSGSDGLFTVIDAPAVRRHPESLRKTLAIFGGVGVVVGLLLSGGYVLVLMRRDRTVSQPQDVQRVTAHAVLMHMPVLHPTSMLLAEPEASRNGNQTKGAYLGRN